MMTLDLEKLKKGASVFGLLLSQKQLELFDIFAAALLEGNKRANLVGAPDAETLLSHHLLDSLSCLIAIPENCLRTIDVGSGAGLPGLPLAIARPDMSVTLLDSSVKRSAFVREVIARLGLRNAEVVCARAEDAGRDQSLREGYDCVVARAVAPLPTLVEYALPFLRSGGTFVAQRGPKAAEESDSAGFAITELNGLLKAVTKVDVPLVSAERYLVEIEKTGPTPARYPRRCGVPLKRPLTGS
ncbi:MAG: 16S rRNA (guanine(527)-N(7))-methyltransferase RsmG [Actinomycetota bacterium]